MAPNQAAPARTCTALAPCRQAAHVERPVFSVHRVGDKPIVAHSLVNFIVLVSTVDGAALVTHEHFGFYPYHFVGHRLLCIRMMVQESPRCHRPIRDEAPTTHSR